MNEPDAGGISIAEEPAFPGMGRSGAALLQSALLDSRHRWRDLVGLAADLAFETDEAGRLVFLWPDRVLGWRSAELLGQPASLLLTAPGNGFDPFTVGPAFRHRRAWLRRADGETACLSFAAAPMLAGTAYVGMRGIAQASTGQDKHAAKVAAMLRRGEVVDHILSQMRQEVLAPRMMQAVLEGLVAALGASGTLVLDLLATPGPEAVLHQAGMDPAALVHGLFEILQAETLDPLIGTVAGHPTLTCPSYTRFGERTGLCVWRAAGGPASSMRRSSASWPARPVPTRSPGC